jgi:hypothetical protein
MSRVVLWVNGRQIEERTGDSVHLLVKALCERAESEVQLGDEVDEERSVLSIYISDLDLRDDSGFALELPQLRQLVEARVALNVVHVVD